MLSRAVRDAGEMPQGSIFRHSKGVPALCLLGHDTGRWRFLPYGFIMMISAILATEDITYNINIFANYLFRKSASTIIKD